MLDERRVKEEAEAKAKEALRQYSAALLIQCWWRGEMVRRGTQHNSLRLREKDHSESHTPHAHTNESESDMHTHTRILTLNQSDGVTQITPSHSHNDTHTKSIRENVAKTNVTAESVFV